MADAWADARGYRDEHERLRQATAHLALAVAEVTRATGMVGDHTSAVPLSDVLEALQMLQSQLATASEKAYSLGQMAANRAQFEDMQARARQALGSEELT